MIIAKDTFTDTVNTELINHVPTIGTEWVSSGITAMDANFVINASNQCQIGAQYASLVGMAISNVLPASQSLQFDYISKSGAGDCIFCFMARCSGSGATFDSYVLFVNPTSNYYAVYCFLSGAYHSQVGTTISETISACTFKMVLVGTSIKLYRDGVLKIDTTDSHITTAGQVGIGFSASSGQVGTMIIDNLIAGDNDKSGEQIGGIAEVYGERYQISGKSEVFDG